MCIDASNNDTKKDFLKLSKSEQKRFGRTYKSSKNIVEYEKIREKIVSTCDFKPTVDQIVKYLKLLYKLLCEEWGYLCKQEIIDKIFHDTATAIRLSKEQIQKLLLMEGF